MNEKYANGSAEIGYQNLLESRLAGFKVAIKCKAFKTLAEDLIPSNFKKLTFDDI